jgi:AraC-like DNA-binding protein
MQSNNALLPSLAYIEQNLKTTIAVKELAGMAGYSVGHYSRLFTIKTGMPVASYIGKRRLDRALAEIIGGRRAIDAALEYGFDTYAGFYKAFVRMYGNSPKSYLKKKGRSVMYTEKELRDILTNWDIPQDLPILDIYIVDGTVMSGSVWSVGEEYILKTGQRDAMLRNMSIMKALAAQGFTASAPILTNTGAEYLGGETIIVLTRGIKGTPLAKADRFGSGRHGFAVKYGQSIARLHNALAAIEPEIQPQSKDMYAAVTGWAIPEIRKQNDHFRSGSWRPSKYGRGADRKSAPLEWMNLCYPGYVVPLRYDGVPGDRADYAVGRKVEQPLERDDRGLGLRAKHAVYRDGWNARIPHPEVPQIPLHQADIFPS